MPTLKQERRRKLLNLLRERKLSTQEQIVEALSSMGIEATQASVSRDFEDLHITKRDGYYIIGSQFSRAVDHQPITLKPCGETLIVVHCDRGLAPALALQIDESFIAEIVGTIAGDDTVFIAVSDKRAQKKAVERLKDLFRVEKTI